MTVDHFVLERLKKFCKTVSLVTDTLSFSTNLTTFSKVEFFKCDFQANIAIVV